MRLQKYLASCGVASRRNAEKMITEGRISVNGIVVTELGTQVDEMNDTVLVDGKPVHPEEEKHYIAYKRIFRFRTASRKAPSNAAPTRL